MDTAGVVAATDAPLRLRPPASTSWALMERCLVEAIAHYAWLAHAIRSCRIADPRLLRQARDEHGAMIGALRRGDRDALVRLAVGHIRPSKDAYLAFEQVAAEQG